MNNLWDASLIPSAIFLTGGKPPSFLLIVGYFANRSLIQQTACRNNWFGTRIVFRQMPFMLEEKL